MIHLFTIDSEKQLFSRKGAKHALSEVEWDAKFGNFDILTFAPLRLCGR
jgi:hypothetical protein